MNCPNFCALSCIDGSCPVAWMEEYIEYGCDVVHDCSECRYSHGLCKDCIYDGTEYCVVRKEGLENGFNQLDL